MFLLRSFSFEYSSFRPRTAEYQNPVPLRSIQPTSLRVLQLNLRSPFTIRDAVIKAHDLRPQGATTLTRENSSPENTPDIIILVVIAIVCASGEGFVI